MARTTKEETKCETAGPTRILIVDDHPLVREGLIGLLSTQSDFVICGEAAGVTDARRVLAEMKPYVAIIDLTLIDGTGIDLIKEFNATHHISKLPPPPTPHQTP